MQQQRGAGKKCRAAKKAKLNSIPELENNYDNLLQHQKDKDVLGSEFSDLKDTLSVTEEMLKEATTRAEKTESKHVDCVENTNKQANKGCCD
jgi:hypothetical protein